MTLTLELPDAKQQTLAREAARRGVAPESLATAWLFEKLDAVQTDGLCDLIQSWIDDGDEVEQRETFEALSQGIDASRVGQRKLFQK